MGHDDPKNPHHHHPDPDDLIAAPPMRRERAPGDSPSGPAHEHAAHDDHGPAGHTHSHTHTGAHGHDESHARQPGGGHPHSASASASATQAAPKIELAHGAGVGKVLHFDCFAGLAGDMIVGALLDLGVPRDPIQQALEGLPIGGYEVGSIDKIVSSIAATKFLVNVDGPQPYRTYRDIKAMLERATFSDGIRKRALAAFRALAIAEGKIHRIAPDEVHFHEVGAIDAIVDIVAASAGLEWLGARVSCAPLPMGRGFTKSEHGIIPLPAPAVVELLAGIPTESTAIELELVTPTGAAIVKANVTEFVRWPSMRPIATGFGAGTRTLADRPNLLRVILGEPIATVDGTAPGVSSGGAGASEFVVLEANLDDATGEMLAHATDALLREGALDAWTSSIGMKKGRPGVMISALARTSEAERLARVLMSESTTLGVRVRPSGRFERPRRSVPVDTPYGRLDVKVSDGDGLPVTAKPEDDEVRAIARERGIPAKTVHAAALAAFWNAQSGREPS